MQDIFKKHPVEFAIAAAILTFCFGFYWSTFANALHTSVDDLGTKQTFGSGTFGDAFGAVNALFTGLALLGLVISILLQRMELKEVRMERKVAQDMLANQIEVNQALENDLRITRLEDRFFKLLESTRVAIGQFNRSHYLTSFEIDIVYENNEFYRDPEDGVIKLQLGDHNPLAVYTKYGEIYEHVRAAYLAAQSITPLDERENLYRLLGTMLSSDKASAITLIVDLRATKNIESMSDDLDLYTRGHRASGHLAKTRRQAASLKFST